MATTHKNIATSLQLGFANGVDTAGNDVFTLKTFSRINPEASDEDVQAAGKELSPLYAKHASRIYRVDTFALEAA